MRIEELLADIPGIEIQHKSVAEYQNYYTIALASSEGFFATPQDPIRVIAGLELHY